MGSKLCKDCRFFELHSGMSDTGFCRRHAPSVHVSVGDGAPIGAIAIWPSTIGDDWCGEYEEKRN